MLTIDEGFGDRVVKFLVEGQEVSFGVSREDATAVWRAYLWAVKEELMRAGDNEKPVVEFRDQTVKDEILAALDDRLQAQTAQAEISRLTDLIAKVNGDGASAIHRLDPAASAIIYNYQIQSRIRWWKGVGFPGGKDAPCTEQYRLRFFGKYPGAMNELRRRLEEQEETEAKNSETSQPG